MEHPSFFDHPLGLSGDDLNVAFFEMPESTTASSALTTTSCTTSVQIPSDLFQLSASTSSCSCSTSSIEDALLFADTAYLRNIRQMSYLDSGVNNYEEPTLTFADFFGHAGLLEASWRAQGLSGGLYLPAVGPPRVPRFSPPFALGLAKALRLLARDQTYSLPMRHSAVNSVRRPFPSRRPLPLPRPLIWASASWTPSLPACLRLLPTKYR